MKTTIEKPKKAPTAKEKAPVATKKASVATKKAPAATKKAPVATKKAPVASKASIAKKATVGTKKGVVKAKPDAAKGLRDFLEDGLKDIYWAEKALTKALPKMAKNATASVLIHAFEHHLKETEEHLARLDKVFESLGIRAVGKKCDAMVGLLKEADGIIEETKVGEVRDAAIIAAAQKVEHYEIATYGTLRVYAATLGENRAELLLAKTLEEVKKTDVTLTEIAMSHINVDAAHGDYR